MRRDRRALHVAEYLMESAALGTFMVSASVCAALLYHPASPMAAVLPNEWLRRGLMGLAMGATAVGLIYSPWGQRSGAHMNPSVTLAYFHLGRVARSDLIGYVAAQFFGGVAGMAVAASLLGRIVADPGVHYVTTRPGPRGVAAAFGAEVVIAFVLMSTVLWVSNHARWARWTGVCAGLLVWVYITVEAPLSGMSMNPARTFGSALVAHEFANLWIYFLAPPLGMLCAAELFVRRYGVQRVVCAKLHHPQTGECIFGCEARRRSG